MWSLSQLLYYKLPSYAQKLKLKVEERTVARGRCLSRPLFLHPQMTNIEPDPVSLVEYFGGIFPGNRWA